jgi:hypothetical protein
VVVVVVVEPVLVARDCLNPRVVTAIIGPFNNKGLMEIVTARNNPEAEGLRYRCRRIAIIIMIALSFL